MSADYVREHAVQITARYLARCGWCGRSIDRGDPMLWLPPRRRSPGHRHTFHPPGRCRTADARACD